MANRFKKPTINWIELVKLVCEEEKGKYLGFKGKSEAYLRRVEANPESPPKIDWEDYKKMVPVEGLVDKLKSAYETFKVPFPEDPLTSKVDEQWSSLQSEIKAYCTEMQAEIEKATAELKTLNALPPFDVMTMEMVYDLYPDQALDPVNKPTFWPHTEEEQLGYVDPHASQKEEH